MAGDWELVHTYQCVLLAIFTYISMYEALRRTLSGIDSHNRLQWEKLNLPKHPPFSRPSAHTRDNAAGIYPRYTCQPQGSISIDHCLALAWHSSTVAIRGYCVGCSLSARPHWKHQRHRKKAGEGGRRGRRTAAVPSHASPHGLCGRGVRRLGGVADFLCLSLLPPSFVLSLVRSITRGSGPGGRAKGSFARNCGQFVLAMV